MIRGCDGEGDVLLLSSDLRLGRFCRKHGRRMWVARRRAGRAFIAIVGGELVTERQAS